MIKEAAHAIKDYFNHDEAFGAPPGTVRGIVFIGLTLTICLLAWTGRPIPDPLSMAWAAVIGHYFGEKMQQKPPPPTAGAAVA